MRAICIAGLIFISAHVFAQQGSFTASVSKTKVTAAERFQLSFTFFGDVNVKDFRPPAFSDFLVLGGPSQSRSISTVNGNVSQSVSFSYVLQARNTGTFTIGAASIKSGDKTYSSQPISMQVTDAPQTPQGNQSTQNNSGEVDINDYLAQNVFIETIVSDDNIYKGEGIEVQYKLYVNANSQVADESVLQELQTPANEGFYVEKYDVNDVAKQYETVDGVKYRVFKFKQLHLTAQKSGDLETGPAVYDCLFDVKVQRNRRKSGDPFQDMFDDFFSDPFSSYKRVRYSVPAKSVKIKVKDLPANPPANFNGAVGKFSMSTELNTRTTKTDEPLTYRVIINGSGNLSLFEAPQLNLPPGWETYDPKVIDGANSKTFEYLLIPRSPGDFTIPAHEWSYFDPNKAQYINLNSEEYKVHVDEGPDYDPSKSNLGVRKEEVELLAKDIRYIKKSQPSFVLHQQPFFGTGIFYSLLGLPLIAGVGIFIMSSRRKKMQEDIAGMKLRKANAIARKRLAAADKFAIAGDSRSFYNETIRALWGYIGDKLGISQSELSKENIYEYLLRYHVSEITARELVDLLDQCEMALFAPSLATTPLHTVYEHTSEVIAKLENEIKK